ncbi:MAG: HAMP domain-containing sensor histidine kinase [Bacteroidota bacterium]
MVLQSVLEDVRNLTLLSNGLLELAQASAHVATISFKEVRMDELLWQARTELLKKYPDFIVSIDFDEMSDDEAVFILEGNEPLLKTAFVNLMENGCKFSDNRQVLVNLHVNAKFTAIRFTAKGRGIDEKDLPHIVEPFYRSETTKHIARHGVGLALTKKIISLHQGSIQVISKVFHGTTFTISLPHQPMQATLTSDFQENNHKFLFLF